MQINCDGVPPTGRIALVGSFGLVRRRSATSTVSGLPMPTGGLSTPRLLLRPWRDEDLAPFAALNADPRVMEHFPSTLDRAASDALAVARIRTTSRRCGFGLWAVEAPGVAEFVGFGGPARAPTFEAHFHALRRDRLAAGLSVLGAGGTRPRPPEPL